MSVPEANEDPEDWPQIKLNGTDGVKFTEIALEKNGLGSKNQEHLSKHTVEVKEMEQDVSELPEENIEDDTKMELKKSQCRTLRHLLRRSRMYAAELCNQIEKGKLSSLRKRKSNTEMLESQSSENKDANESSEMEQTGDKVDNGGNDEEGTEGEVPFEDDDFDFFNETRVTSQGFTVSHYQPILVEGGVLRDYQLKGVQWMTTLFKNGVSGILADEMGLGKTLQVIGLISELIEKGMCGPFLIIAPLSTLGNWIAEFQRFAPSVPTLLFHGSKRQRKKLISCFKETVSVLGKDILKVVITSYEVVMFEKKALSKVDWLHITVDEGHRMKNHNSLLSRTLRDFSSVGKLLLTGTPLQNNLSELWSLLNFIIPEVFNSLEAFKSWFDVQQFENDGLKFMEENYNINVITTVQQILMPFLLRREKKDVSLKLPPKKEILVYCPLTAMQKRLYESTVDRSIEFLLRPKRAADCLMEPLPKRACVLFKNFQSHPDDVKYAKDLEKYRQKYCQDEYDEGEYDIHIQLRNPQMQLRKIVNHPYLIQYPLVPGTNELKIDEDLVKNSGKLLVVDAMLSKLKAQGHKVVIFSTFKLMLDILEDLAYLRNYRYYRMDGSSKHEDRQEYIFQFNTNPDIFLFLVSMRSGGLGINLTGADTIIIYDSDWNPQINLQSQDRCHRIGQTKPVVIYKLCVRGTIDERIVERGNAKRKLEKMIIQKGKFTRGVLDSDYKFNVTDLKELKKLLLSTDYDSVINSNGSVFTDEELEALLDRSDMITDAPDNDTEKQIVGEKVFKVINSEPEE